MRLVVAILLVLGSLVATAAAKVPPPPREAAVVATGASPCGVAVGKARVWIGLYESGRLLALGARDGRRRAATRVGSGACRVAVGARAVWVTRDRAGEIVRVPLGAGPIRRAQVGSGAFDVVLAAGSIWATSFDTGVVSRLSPDRLARIRSYDVGPKPAGIAACGGSIWVGHGGTATWLTAIDPASGRTRRVDVVVEAPGWPRCIRGKLWVTTSDAVLEVDARTGRLLRHVAIGGTPAEAAAGADGLVWVTDKQRSLVHRVDPGAGRVVDAFPAGPGAYSLARAGSAMWISSFAGSDVRRFVP